MTLPTEPRTTAAMLSRRGLLRAAVLAGGAAGAGTLVGAPSTAFGAPAQRRSRPEAVLGVQSGDVTGHSAVVWSKTDRPARMVVEVAATESFRGRRQRFAVEVGPDSDFTGKALLTGLPAGTELFYRVQFADHGNRGQAGEPLTGSFRTAPTDRRNVRFAWSGDVAGQGWGINPDTGGMTGFEAVRDLDPDFFVHSGDSIYADGPLQEQVVLPDGQVWRNIVTPEKSKVAETLEEYRGQYRYNLLDDNVRRFAAQVPQLVQWDDHEVTNNWYPGEILTDTGGDARYTEKRVDVLAARARQAFLEYMPIGGTRIDRRLSYGPLVEVFSVDLRTYRGPNTENTATSGAASHIFGDEQLTRLAAQLRDSRALWKVVACDMPLGLVVPDGPVRHEGIANRDAGAPSGRELELARLLSDLKRFEVRNVVWLTADVHYTAAHYYDPAKATFSDFDPFYEFVTGPLHAGTFGPNVLDATFGPQLLFSRTADRPNQPPSDGLQFLGQVEIDGASGVMTVQLRDVAGSVLHSTDLSPR